MVFSILTGSAALLRCMRGAVLAALPVVAFAPAALAADAIIEGPPEAPMAIEQPVGYVWTGPYIGAYGSYQWYKTSVEDFGSEKSHGWTGGGYAGYNYQMPNNIVLGIEAMGGFSDAEDNIGGARVEQDWEASLRGRMGYAFENSMIYGLAGLGATRLEASVPGDSDSNVHLGWNLGAGYETMLTQNLTGRLEYDYTDYHSQEYSLGGSRSDIDFRSHAVKLGVGLKF